MTRSRASAKSAGSRFERTVADYLAAEVDDRIDRRTRTGANDKGDIAGLRFDGERITIECKDTSRTDLAGWYTEARREADNDGALLGVVVHKRRGISDPARQWVTMTLQDFADLLRGRQ